MAGLELRSYGIGSDSAVNCATPLPDKAYGLRSIRHHLGHNKKHQCNEDLLRDCVPYDYSVTRC